MVLQLGSLKIVDEDRRIFEGLATVEMVDNDRDILPFDEMVEFMDAFMDRGGVFTDEHTDKIVGKVLEYWKTEVEVTPELMKNAGEHNPRARQILQQYQGMTLPAIAVRGQVFSHFAYDNDVWDKIKDQSRPDAIRGMSFTTRVAPVRYDMEHKGIVHTVRAIFSLALTKVPKVALALLTSVNELAQSEEEKATIKDAIESEYRCSACGHDMRQTETLNKPEKEEENMSESDKNEKPAEPVQDEKQAEPTPSQPGASEERSEAPSAASIDALSSEMAGMKTRLAVIEERIAPAQPVEPEAQADGTPDPQADEKPAEEPAGEPKDEEQGDQKPEAPSDEKPAEESPAPVEDKKESEDKDEEPKPEDKDKEQSDTPATRLIESDARGTKEIRQSGDTTPVISAYAVATGEQQVSYAELREVSHR